MIQPMVNSASPSTLANPKKINIGKYCRSIIRVRARQLTIIVSGAGMLRPK
jgi:hypothetical protein